MNESAVPYKYLTIRQFHMILAVWSNPYDDSISIPPFGGGVLDCNIGANINLRKRVCFLIVILLVVIVDSDFLGVYLPAVLKCEAMCWQGVLNWLPIQFLCWGCSIPS